MSLKKWATENRLSAHNTSANEIQSLFRVVERDISDAGITELSTDRRFVIAYNAVLQLATIVLRCHGYRTHSSRGGHHWISFAVLPDILGQEGKEYSEYFNVCRIKRNTSDYSNTDEISEKEVEELIKEAGQFRDFVTKWLETNFPQYIKEYA